MIIIRQILFVHQTSLLKTIQLDYFHLKKPIQKKNKCAFELFLPLLLLFHRNQIQLFLNFQKDFLKKSVDAIQTTLQNTDKKLGISEKSSEIGKKTAQTLKNTGEGLMILFEFEHFFKK